MNRRRDIPVRFRRPAQYDPRLRRQEVDGSQRDRPTVEDPKQNEAEPKSPEQAPVAVEATQREAEIERTESSPEAQEWQDRAMRLQADMENFRKRQKRLAADQIESERQRLLGAFLRVMDDLERALTSTRGDEAGLREGVRLTYRAAQRLMEGEGVQKIEAAGQPFDPSFHEAVSTVDSDYANVAAGTVAKVVEPGYRLGDQLLRPSKVIVAV